MNTYNMPAGIGLSTATTIYTPTVGEVIGSIFGFSEPSQGGRYPDPRFTPCRWE